MLSIFEVLQLKGATHRRNKLHAFYYAKAWHFGSSDFYRKRITLRHAGAKTKTKQSRRIIRMEPASLQSY